MNMELLFYEVINPNRPAHYVPLYWLLKGISVFYALIQKIRATGYAVGIFRSRKLGCRVISVGNLTLGGTGKTPTVLAIAETLQQHGYRPAILSRGYGGDPGLGVNVVSDGSQVLLSAEEAGDEPLMMARRLHHVPVLTGKSRYRSGRFALDHFNVDTLILDDGFQHLPLKRDVNIVLCDAQRPFGIGGIFPAGELREPADAIGRADVICLTRYGDKGKADALYNPKQAPVIKTVLKSDSLWDLKSETESGLSTVQGKKVGAFCGIGKPDQFFETVKGLGVDLVWSEAFPDHFDYAAFDFSKMEQQARQAGAELLLTTEKDAVKLSAKSFSLPLYSVRVTLDVVEGRDEWLKHILPDPQLAPSGKAETANRRG